MSDKLLEAEGGHDCSQQPRGTNNADHTGGVSPKSLEVTRLVRMEVIAIVLVVTLPFGFWRAYTRKLSLRWFLSPSICRCPSSFWPGSNRISRTPYPFHLPGFCHRPEFLVADWDLVDQTPPHHTPPAGKPAFRSGLVKLAFGVSPSCTFFAASTSPRRGSRQHCRDTPPRRRWPGSRHRRRS